MLYFILGFVRCVKHIVRVKISALHCCEVVPGEFVSIYC